MNIFRKVALFVGSGLIIIGVIVAILGFAFGGRFQTPPSGHLFNYTYSFNTERINVNETYENVDSIVIDYSAGSLSIQEGDSFKIVANNVVKSRFESSVKDGVWTVTDKKDGTWSFLNSIHFGKDDSTVTLYIPKSMQLKDCSFELGAGKIEADSLNTKSFHLKVGAGEVIIKNLASEDTTFDCGVGSIKVDGAISGDSTLKNGVGQISLVLKGNPKAYNYNVKVGIGTAKINGNSYTGVSDQKITNDNATGNFTLDCGIGEIGITITP